jgi:ferritin-like metal-binding protein YciE
MLKVTTPRQLLLHKLGETLYVERAQEREVLPKLLQEVGDEELRDGLEKHVMQTREHARRVEQAFQTLGESPTPQRSAAFEGLKMEQAEVVSQVDPALIDMVDSDAAAHTEHLEIGLYEALITMARQLGEKSLVDPLEKNLKDEKETLRRVERISRRLAKETAKELSAV